MRMHRFPTDVLAFFLTIASAAGAAELEQLRSFTWWRDLANATRIDLGGDVRVRLSVDTDRPLTGGHVVILCLTEGVRADAFAHGSLGDDRVGPVKFRIEPIDEDGKVVKPKAKPAERNAVAEHVRVAQEAGPRVEDAELLFSRAVPTPQSGSFLITLSTPDGRDVASQPFFVVPDVLPSWSPLDATFPAAAKLTPADAEAKVRVYVKNAAPRPVEPVWQPDRPIVWKGTVDGKAFARDKDDLLPSMDYPEDGGLTYDQGVLVFTTKRPVSCRPDVNLIARWWVNEKPVRSKQVAEPMRQLTGRIDSATEHRMRLTFDAARCGAKRGDKVKLQLAWCEQGWQAWSPGQAKQHAMIFAADPTGPGPVILSNPVEFVVP